MVAITPTAQLYSLARISFPEGAYLLTYAKTLQQSPQSIIKSP